MARSEQQPLTDRIHELTDVELAILLALIAEENCLIDTEASALDDLESEIRLILSNGFGLSFAIIACDEETTPEEFANRILEQEDRYRDSLAKARVTGGNYASPLPKFTSERTSGSRRYEIDLDDRKIVNVVVAKNLNLASEAIQIQALELIRTRRILTRTAVHTAPKNFAFVGLTSKSASYRPLNKHLRDHVFISHYHDPELGFANLEEQSEWLTNQTSDLMMSNNLGNRQSAASVASVSPLQIGDLRRLSNEVTMVAEVRQFYHDVVVSLRLHRAVAGGISARATLHYEKLLRCMASLHGVDYVSPSLVSLAAWKIYPHRIVVATPQQDRSLMYGSELAAVEKLLDGLTPEDIIEDVLSGVEPPV